MSQVDAIRNRQAINRQKLDVLITMAQVYRMPEWEARLKQIAAAGNSSAGLVEALVTQVVNAAAVSGNEPGIAQGTKAGRKSNRVVAQEPAVEADVDETAVDVGAQTPEDTDEMTGEEATE